MIDQPFSSGLFAYLLHHRFPRPADTSAGAVVTLIPENRWARRDMKTTMLLPAVQARQTARDRGASEALFVGNDGLVSDVAS